MPSVSWDAFAALPGAADVNFEKLCRALMFRHYGQYGRFAGLANQPGVEFHLKLETACGLGEPGRWYGWQCRWYELPPGRALGKTRRDKIEEAIRTTEVRLPQLTDWVLWTRYPLTRADQEWFYAISTKMKLALWTAAEVEDHLIGPAELLRGSYFGELILKPDTLAALHSQHIAPIKRRWMPEVHQTTDVERELRKMLVEPSIWVELEHSAQQLRSNVVALAADSEGLDSPLAAQVTRLCDIVRGHADALSETRIAIETGDLFVVRQQPTALPPNLDASQLTLPRRLRNARHKAALRTTNAVSDVEEARNSLSGVDDCLGVGLVAVLADAGCGKTQLAAELTAAQGDRPCGVFLQGGDLHAGHSLDDLARRVTVFGSPCPSMDALLAAVDAAGQRAGRRLPLLIDGLNEAEDPRVWKSLLASLRETLSGFPYVLVVCTLRPSFAKQALPDDVRTLEIPNFGRDAPAAVRRYFAYFKISFDDARDSELPSILRHPLMLRMFCEVANPERTRIVGVEAMPTSLSGVFIRYLDQVAERIAEISSHRYRYYPQDINIAINKIGLLLWEQRSRSVEFNRLREVLGDTGRSWDLSVVHALEENGVLIRVADDGPTQRCAVVYGALAGHIVADALLGDFGRDDFQAWIQAPETRGLLTPLLPEGHPLGADIFASLVALLPRRGHGRQLWTLVDEPIRSDALWESAKLEGALLDRATVDQLAELVLLPPDTGPHLFARLFQTRGSAAHPLNAEFIDRVLRLMTVADRDRHWTEWVRRNHTELLTDLQRLEQR